MASSSSSSSSSPSNPVDASLSTGWTYIPAYKQQVTTHRLPNGDREIHVHFPSGTKVIRVENIKSKPVPAAKPAPAPAEEDDDWTVVPSEVDTQCVAGNVKAQCFKGVKSVIGRVLGGPK